VLAPAYPPIVCWAALEVGLRIRDAARARSGQDRGSRAVIALALAGSVWGAFAARALAPGLDAATGWPGVVLLWLGLALRVWAVVALGAAFRTTVGVEPGQVVVTRGPYRWVRHPSYTGLLAILAGFGLAVGNWLALVICLVLPAAALLRRIRVEEAVLEQALPGYAEYEARTARLLPGIW
jgi:protein-S-isoprenylcysteine O-methyltransferase Ste14